MSFLRASHIAARAVAALCCLMTCIHPTVLAVPTTTDDFVRLNKEFGQAPTNARIDRVWKGIPGLSGWQLDIPASQRLTASATDGKYHLQWQSVAPTEHLEKLPPAPVYRAPATEKSATLMINVSWGEEYLPSMIETLHKEGVRATFFLDGAWVKKNLTLARKLVEEGQDIGSHGTGHPDFRQLSMEKLSRQLDVTHTILYTQLGVDSRIIAPPSGSYDERLVQLARHRQTTVILWTADTVDWKHPRPAVILERVRSQLTPGMMILMHPTAETAQALPQIIHLLRNQGYCIKTVSDVLAERRMTHPPKVLAKEQN
ncbi:polysaccharide deacetylase family protein [Alicyclobacillus sp. TC]|uniref:polysaccharide deacetylase family protein n=1 Tax=Alicyclobacillus sp. TC TaxID=2606450 RepID=UPI0019333AA8|nr:polysaccharide deacetylase family protein [Alicyclobacillus sp. TC]QRF23679.1 polysaccharide deacetylase family protein [Alicyclobacillus sp. TC]